MGEGGCQNKGAANGHSGAPAALPTRLSDPSAFPKETAVLAAHSQGSSVHPEELTETLYTYACPYVSPKCGPEAQTSPPVSC